MNDKNEKKEIRDIIIHIAFTESEKANIKIQAKNSNMSISEFVRQSVFDKIRRIEHPDTFSQSQTDPAFLEQIKKNTMLSMELKDLLIKRDIEIKEMKDSLELIKELSLKPDLETKNIILTLFNTYSSLNPKEIIDKTNLNQELVFSIISELQNENIIEMTSKGRFRLK